MAIEVGDAILRFLGDTTDVDGKIARVAGEVRQATGQMSGDARKASGAMAEMGRETGERTVAQIVKAIRSLQQLKQELLSQNAPADRMQKVNERLKRSYDELSRAIARNSRESAGARKRH